MQGIGVTLITFFKGLPKGAKNLEPLEDLLGPYTNTW